MDLSFWPKGTKAIKSLPRRFQSLLWWICHFDMCLQLLLWFRLLVSILVMMDLSFWLGLVFSHIPVALVSILVMMDLSFWLVSVLVGVVTPEFQSLLWWICHFDVFQTVLLVGLLSFNPCYDGFVILTEFYWWWDKNDSVSILVMMDLSFWLILSLPLSKNPRVSILVMMDLSFWLERLELWLLCRLVSILVMMDLSFWHTQNLKGCSILICFNPCYDGFVILTLEAKRVSVPECESFNPCYDGFVILTWRLMGNSYPCLVSILVMMDLSFWQQKRILIAVGIPFQSLLWWICHFDNSYGC